MNLTPTPELLAEARALDPKVAGAQADMCLDLLTQAAVILAAAAHEDNETVAVTAEIMLEFLLRRIDAIRAAHPETKAVAA